MQFISGESIRIQASSSLKAWSSVVGEWPMTHQGFRRFADAADFFILESDGPPKFQLRPTRTQKRDVDKYTQVFFGIYLPLFLLWGDPLACILAWISTEARDTRGACSSIDLTFTALAASRLHWDMGME